MSVRRLKKGPVVLLTSVNVVMYISVRRLKKKGPELRQRANVRVSEETCDERSHILQVMRDLERVRRGSESSEAREVRLQALRIHLEYKINLQEPVLLLFLHHQ